MSIATMKRRLAALEKRSKACAWLPIVAGTIEQAEIEVERYRAANPHSKRDLLVITTGIPDRNHLLRPMGGGNVLAIVDEFAQ